MLPKFTLHSLLYFTLRISTQIPSSAIVLHYLRKMLILPTNITTDAPTVNSEQFHKPRLI